VNTEGYACPNHQCPSFGITDAHIHALVGDGKHGQAEQIQTFRCQACHTTFSARRHTPLYRLKTPSQQVAVVLSALAEGLDPSAAERVFGYRQTTITSLSHSRSPCTQSSSMSAASATCTSHISSWTNCARGCGVLSKSYGCGWPSILSHRFFRCFSSVPAPNTWRTCSSTLSERA
jgi:transposase-like protein